jgi:hypothetical protein
MNREEIIRIAKKAGGDDWGIFKDFMPEIERFAALVAAVEREKVAQWMIQHCYATGHGETTEDLLAELDWQIAENWNRAMINGVETEREACLKEIKPNATPMEIAAAIRARGSNV